MASASRKQGLRRACCTCEGHARGRSVFGTNSAVTDQDKLVYVNNVIKGKLLESETLRQQATNNTKEQFANSPDLKGVILLDEYLM